MPRSAPGPLRGGRKARPLRHKACNTGRLVKACAPRKTAVDDHAHAIDGQAGFGNVRGEYDLAPPLNIAPDGKPLRRRVNLPMQFMHDNVGPTGTQSVKGAVNLADAGQEYQQVALLL